MSREARSFTHRRHHQTSAAAIVFTATHRDSRRRLSTSLAVFQPPFPTPGLDVASSADAHCLHLAYRPPSAHSTERALKVSKAAADRTRACLISSREFRPEQEQGNPIPNALAVQASTPRRTHLRPLPSVRSVGGKEVGEPGD